MLHGLPLLVAALLAGAANASVCDIYSAGGTPCVAAHSTVRSLYSSFTGPMYQVKRSDGTTKDIKPLSAGGVANAASQDTFCSGSSCVISIIYDQSGKGNHLTPAPGGSMNPKADSPASATKLPITIGGHRAYGVWIDQGMGYRNNNAVSIPINDQAEAIYMVASGTHVNGGCCFDYGNAERNNQPGPDGSMETVYLGTARSWSFGQGSGPWVMSDLEDGVFGCDHKSQCPNLPSISAQYVTGMVKGRSGGTFALKQGNAQSGRLTTTYDGPRPSTYRVMQKRGAIVLGIGGDNSNSAVGSFFEGVMVAGNPSNSVDDQVQANIVAAGYGSSTGSSTTPETDVPATRATNSTSSTTRAPRTATVGPDPAGGRTRPTSEPEPWSPGTVAPARPAGPTGGARRWGKCGGVGYNGPTTCAEGKCVRVNNWYSQCQ